MIQTVRYSDIQHLFSHGGGGGNKKFNMKGKTNGFVIN